MPDSHTGYGTTACRLRLGPYLTLLSLTESPNLSLGQKCCAVPPTFSDLSEDGEAD